VTCIAPVRLAGADRRVVGALVCGETPSGLWPPPHPARSPSARALRERRRLRLDALEGTRERVDLADQ